MVPEGPLTPETVAFYRESMQCLKDAGVSFLVGGAYALACHAGILRHTKDLDLFLRRRDLEAALAALTGRGCVAERTFPHWLAKVIRGDDFVDLIYSSGNGIAVVDDDWFTHAVDGDVLGVPVRLCPAEEMIWSKAFLLERERYDGADVAHMLYAKGRTLSWPRLLSRFGVHWPVLLSHIVLFGYIYPSERDRVPPELTARLLEWAREDLGQPPRAERVCRGTLVSRSQYLVDIRERGFTDARLAPDIGMTVADVEHWTRAIDDDPLAAAQQPLVVGADEG
jgi:hypothetical protein